MKGYRSTETMEGDVCPQVKKKNKKQPNFNKTQQLLVNNAEKCPAEVENDWLTPKLLRNNYCLNNSGKEKGRTNL